MTETSPQRSLLGRALRLIALTLGPVVIVLVGGYVYLTSGRYVTTENAYVKTDLIIITAEVTGKVVDVNVRDNQRVERDALLFRIDPSRYQVALARAIAELNAARQRVSTLKARYRTRLAELRAAEDDLAFLTAEFDRTTRLRKSGAISQFKLIEAQRTMNLSESRITVLQEAVGEVLTDLAGNPDLPADDHPDVRRALAEVEQAELDLAATEVFAPEAGVAANVTLQAGEYLEDGDAVLSIVSDHSPWVVANLKETDLTHLAPGQSATLRVDAYPGIEWRAEVDSLSPATGSEYALLPPQNASGNWVKVVQRVPIRLTIEPQDGTPPLRAGMSVAVSIDTGIRSGDGLAAMAARSQ